MINRKFINLADKFNQMALLDRITTDPNVLGGKPTIRKMRFSVAQLLELLAGGMSFEEILDDYPYLELDDIRACLSYAALIANAGSIRKARA